MGQVHKCFTNTHLANVQEMGVWLPFWKQKKTILITTQKSSDVVKQSDTEPKEKVLRLYPGYYMLNLGFYKKLFECFISALIRQFGVDRWEQTCPVNQHGGSLFTNSSPAIVLIIIKGMSGWKVVTESCYLSQELPVWIPGKCCKQKPHVHSSEERR